MIFSRQKSGPDRHYATTGAFSLIELIVVVVILTILVMLLMPAIQSVRENARLRNDAVFVTSLSQACQAYARDHDNLYPGQYRYTNNSLYSETYFSRMEKTSAHHLTGTQVLVAELTGMVVDNSGKWTTGQNKPSYLDIKANQLDLPMADGAVDESLGTAQDNAGVQTISGARHSVLDSMTNPLPMLYYVSRPGRRGSGPKGCFRYDDNVRVGQTLYPEDSATAQKSFYEFLTQEDDPGSDLKDKMYRSDSFVIIAAGKDRAYFTLDSSGNTDDLANFNRTSK